MAHSLRLRSVVTIAAASLRVGLRERTVLWLALLFIGMVAVCAWLGWSATHLIGQIYARFEAAGLKIVAARMVRLARVEAEAFYAVHKGRPFFNDLVSFMISGPVMIQALEGENAVLKNRDLMGATDPKKAAPGTIRADFADSIDANAVHGSDAAETAAV